MVPIGTGFRVVNGATPKSGEAGLWDGDIPWITPADRRKSANAEILFGARSITRQGLNSCGTQIVPTGSVVLSIRAPVGHTAVAAQPMCFNRGCRGLVPSQKVLTKFGYWAILSAKPQLQSEAQGTTFQELGRDKLRAIKIPVPDLATQRGIADFLERETTRIDLLIEKKQRLVALLGEQRASAISSAVTLGLDDDTKVVTTSSQYLPQVPATWRVWRLKHLAEIRGGLTLGRKISDDVKTTPTP
ncbi:MAG: restriction endonuclease subunit S [Paracoccus sp. (in: a-proteobacteria)]|uniref:restriction endonuclease subunit S n=1 Tax=Paracoccus sp. TaxID=267 RepID=UPI00405836C3